MGFLSDLLFGKKPDIKSKINKKVWNDFIEGKMSGLEMDDEIIRRAGQYGQSLFDQVDRNAAARKGSINQGAVNRGLFNTTVLDSAHRGADRQHTQELAIAKDAVFSNMMNALAGKKATFLTQFGQSPKYYDASRSGGVLSSILGGAAGGVGDWLGKKNQG